MEEIRLEPINLNLLRENYKNCYEILINDEWASISSECLQDIKAYQGSCNAIRSKDAIEDEIKEWNALIKKSIEYRWDCKDNQGLLFPHQATNEE